MSTGIISGIKECTSSRLARRKNKVTKHIILLTLWHECLLIRAEMPLKDRYTLIEHSNNLIEQSDHLATEIKNEHNYGNNMSNARIKKQ